MKNSFNKFALMLSAATGIAMSLPSIASASEADTMIKNAKSTLVSSADPFIDLILVIIGLVGIVFVVINAVKYFKEDRESETSLFKVGIGIILAVIIIYVIKSTFLKA